MLLLSNGLPFNSFYLSRVRTKVLILTSMAHWLNQIIAILIIFFSLNQECRTEYKEECSYADSEEWVLIFQFQSLSLSTFQALKSWNFQPTFYQTRRCVTVDRPTYHQVCDTEYVQNCDGGGYQVVVDPGSSFKWKILLALHDCTGWFFYCSARKMQAPWGNLRTVPAKKRLRKKKVKVPELFLPHSRNSSNTNVFSENLLKVGSLELCWEDK